MNNCNCNTSSGGNCSSSDPIELIQQGRDGAAGAAGADGASVLYNEHTNVSDIDNLNPQILKTYTLDNTPTPVLNSNGDYITIETNLTVKAGVSAELYIEVDSTKMATYNIVSIFDDEVKIKVVMNRTTGVSAQVYESTVEILGSPSTIVDSALSTATVNMSADADITVNSQKSVKLGAADIVCKYLRVTLYKI